MIGRRWCYWSSVPALLIGGAAITGSYSAELLDNELHSRVQNLHTVGPSEDADNRYALLVGISDYPGEEDDLNGGPLNDVYLMEDLLVTTFGFSKENVLVLTDREGTRDGIVAAFRQHLSQAPPNGVAVFYYSGHGSQIPNYVRLTEGAGNDVESDGLDEILVVRGPGPDRISYLLDDELGILVGELHASRILVILDNCYSGTGTRGIPGGIPTWEDLLGVSEPAVNLSNSLIIPQLYQGKRLATQAVIDNLQTDVTPMITRGAATSQPKDHILLSAAAEQELSLNVQVQLEDGSSPSAGLFTLALYAQLAGIPAHKAVTFRELTAQLKVQINAAVIKLHAGPQTPQLEGPHKNALVHSYLGAQ